MALLLVLLVSCLVVMVQPALACPTRRSRRGLTRRDALGFATRRLRSPVDKCNRSPITS